MPKDIVRTLGYATLGSRLKRLGELLQAQTAELALGVSQVQLPVPQNPVLAALDTNGPMSIGELAKALGQSQPGITRMINQMKKDGLVHAAAGTHDQRVRKIALTDRGNQLVQELKTSLWPATAQAVSDACQDLSGPLLDQLTQLESALSVRPLKARTNADTLPDWDAIQTNGDQNT
ncbi:MarR family winged helix-turn-helix transcriptional regulator [Labrenzia sp. PHM005]|uniref:MarR family winged helix-turn-helix transcriptional regulator n=1 Tax=Labrenzia sp. PHM005 TaxID=2590016 RepID=UPI00113FCD48|nr:MarR family transcriptional regulator [Labrenzia sp. PHM005]QDG78967.1 MarR family transcriptional regulator [Labrenzia sp. PHM005]